MADVAASVSGPPKLAYLDFNTLFNLPGRERRIDCFRNVAAVLEPGGLFVTECFVQDLTEFDRGQRVTFDAQGTTLRPLWLSYCWPSELDLMARLAGMRLRERYADWDRSAFTGASRSHVSVFERTE
jgi:hypothetical protein